MAIYYFLLAGVIVAGVPLCSKRCGRSGRIIYCCAAALVFIFISALRFNVGYDYYQYATVYFNMKYTGIEDIMYDRMEKGFTFPLYALNLGFENYITVFVYTSIIVYASIFYLIYKNSSCPWISVASFLCFGIFFNSLCFLRQIIAAIIIAYAFKYINSKMPVRFFILVLAASAFHWSALIMLLLFFLVKIKPGYLYLGLVIAGTIIFCIFSMSFLTWATEHFYMYSGYALTSNHILFGLDPHFAIMDAVIFIVCFIFRKRLIEKNPANAAYINCMMYTTVFETMGIRHSVLSRFAILTYIPPMLYMLPDLVYVIKDYIAERFALKGRNFTRAVNICAVSASAIFAFGFYVLQMFTDESGVVPYVSQMNRPFELFGEIAIEQEDNEEQWILEDMQEEPEDYEDVIPENGGSGDEIADSVDNNDVPTDDVLNDESTDDEDWDEEGWDDEDWDDEDWDDEGWGSDMSEEELDALIQNELSRLN